MPHLDYQHGPFFEDNVNSGIYPYSAYTPSLILKRPSVMDPQHFATRLQRLIIPTTMPGLDAHQIINKRERFIEACIQQRIRRKPCPPPWVKGFSAPTLRRQQRRQGEHRHNP